MFEVSRMRSSRQSTNVDVMQGWTRELRPMAGLASLRSRALNERCARRKLRLALRSSLSSAASGAASTHSGYGRSRGLFPVSSGCRTRQLDSHLTIPRSEQNRTRKNLQPSNDGTMPRRSFNPAHHRMCFYPHPLSAREGGVVARTRAPHVAFSVLYCTRADNDHQIRIFPHSDEKNASHACTPLSKSLQSNDLLDQPKKAAVLSATSGCCPGKLFHPSR
jgi:hypothetical protein